MKTIKKIIQKKENKAFGKKIYLLGENKDGEFLWLEEPYWNCGWYWGFGYIETYAANNLYPEKAKNINSHQHISSFLGKQKVFNSEKNCWQIGECIYNLIDSPQFASTTFNEEESWELTELFKQFYLLKDMVEFSHKELPGCDVITSPVNHGNLKDWCKKINQKMIPKITTKIIEILTPVKPV